MRRLFSAFAVSLLGASAAFAAPTLTVGTVSGQAGTTVAIPITFNPTPNAVTGLQFNLTLPASLSTGTVTPGSIVTAANKSVSANRSGNTWTFIIFGINQTAIGSGTLLTAEVTIAAGTAVGGLTIPISGIIYSDANGQPIAGGTSTGGTVTVTPLPPVITSAGTATGTVGTAFSYSITATNSPTSFNAVGLPAGLTVNTGTGLISGTPTTVGVSISTLSATNAGGTGTRQLTLTVNPPPPAITSAGTATGTVGTAFSYSITATNSPTSFNATSLPAGLTVNTGTGLISGTPTTVGISTSTVSAANAGGSGNRVLTVTIYSVCDLNTDTATNVADVQLEVNQAIGVAACTGDINKDTLCNVLDVQRVVNAALGGQCVSP